jgi:beta-glucanase (GH16 family)
VPAPSKGKTRKLVWHDEFDGDRLDESKWDVPPDAKRRDGWWMRKAIALDGKRNLAIRTFKDGNRYVDGCVRTLGKFEHAFGYFVAGIRLQRQVGHWSAFWLMGRDQVSAGASASCFRASSAARTSPQATSCQPDILC